jgi:nucleotide-binding universal stress UspA family protein
MSIRHILVPVDLSERSAPALRWSVELGRALAADVVALHVVAATAPTPTTRLQSWELSSRPIPPATEQAIARARREIGELVKTIDHAGVELCARVELGDPASLIVTLAVEEAHGLVVLGVKPREGVADRLLGGVADAVVARAPCPVVCIREGSAS